MDDRSVVLTLRFSFIVPRHGELWLAFFVAAIL